ncbi:MAG: molybdopterin-binding protein [Bilophila wadsworthia]
MNAEIISVGTELLLGHTINTDAAFVARELSAIGVNLLFACTVGDNPGRLRDALEEALGRSDVVITTGGLGPTDDDLTKETIASVAGAPLKIHEDSLRRLESYFKGRPAMGENHASRPCCQGATVFPNDIGPRRAAACGRRPAR